jgi:hypothetical protein
MKFQIAIFDHAKPGPHKDYWVVRHPELEPAVLNSVYYDAIKAYPKDDIYDGAFKLTSGRACLFRLFGGKRDQIGRGGQFVVVCAFFNSAEAVGEELSETFRNSIFDDLERAYEKDGAGSSRLQTQSIDLQLTAIGIDIRNNLHIRELNGKRLFTGEDAIRQSLMFTQKLPQSVGWSADFSKKAYAAVSWKNILDVKEPDSTTSVSTDIAQSSGKFLQLLTHWNLRIKSWHLVGVLICMCVLGFAFKHDSPWPRMLMERGQLSFSGFSPEAPDVKVETDDSSLRHQAREKKFNNPELCLFLSQNKNALFGILFGFLIREMFMISRWILRHIKRLFLWLSREKT